VGQVLGQLNRIKPMKDVVHKIVDEYIHTVERMSGTLLAD
jgi:hypothetical protein